MATLAPRNAPELPRSWSYEGYHILKTKLFLAHPRIPTVARPQLSNVLHTSLSYPLTVIVAPAGAGKTTLLSSWIQVTSVSTAFLSLDSDDNDPTRFWTYVVVALERIQPQLKPIIRSMLQVAQQPPMETILTTIINSLCEVEQESVLVLDDYHMISNSAIHTSLNFFIEHLPPQFHLVIATRVSLPLPVAKLRADGGLQELCEEDLKFSLAEIRTFFIERAGLHLDEMMLAEIAKRTEGWVAGLHLVVLMLRKTEDVATWINRISGRHQLIADYLISEVVCQQPPHIQQFLLETAFVKRLCGPLCDTITGRNDSQCLLEQVQQANLFLIPLDDEQEWYRYHHLFAEALRAHMQRQAPERVREVHRRASAWYAEAGNSAEAVHQALAAQEWDQAAHLIVTQGLQCWAHGELETVQRWLTAVPIDVMNHHLQLRLLQAWLPILMGQEQAFVTVEQQLDLIEQALIDDKTLARNLNPALLQSEIAAIRSYIALSHGNTNKAMHLCQVADTVQQQDEQAWWYDTVVALSLGDTAFQLNDIRTAQQSYSRALNASQKTRNIPIELYARYNLAQMSGVQSKLHDAVAQLEEAVRCAEGHSMGDTFIAGRCRIMLGGLHYEWNNLEVALRMVQDGIAITEQTGDISMARLGYGFLTRVHKARQDVQAAHAVAEHMHQLAQKQDILAQEVLNANQALIWLANDQLERAAQWAQDCRLDPDGELTCLNEFLYFSLACVWVAQKQVVEALPILIRLREYTEGVGKTWRLIHVLVQQTLAYYYRNDQELATQALLRAIHLAEPEGYQRVFFDGGAPIYMLLQMICVNEEHSPYVRQLLSTFPMHNLHCQDDQIVPPNTISALPHSPDTVSPDTTLLHHSLSVRECEVLRLLARGYTNGDIARELILAESSIKTYLKRIYRKLRVQSRTQAIVRGREKGIL